MDSQGDIHAPSTNLLFVEKKFVETVYTTPVLVNVTQDSLPPFAH